MANNSNKAKELTQPMNVGLLGIGTVGMEIFYYLALANIAPAHGSLLVRLSIPLSLAVGWVLFARRPPRLALIELIPA